MESCDFVSVLREVESSGGFLKVFGEQGDGDERPVDEEWILKWLRLWT
jgi:hypothetical protein